MKIRSIHNHSGITLAVVVTTLGILMVVVGIAIEETTTISRNTQRGTSLLTAQTVADNAIEVMFNNWRSTCRGTPNHVFKTSDFAAIPTPSPFPGMPTTNFVKRGSGTDYFDPANDQYDSQYIVSNYKVVGVNAEYGALADANTAPIPQLGQVSGNISSVASTTSVTYNYIASADVTLPAPNGSPVVARVRRVFSKQLLPPWNWAIFYVDPLEIHPGPKFTITGRVHTNSNLYTGHNTLTFADKVTYGSDWIVGFMPGDQYHPETPQAPNYPAGLPPARSQPLQPFGLDPANDYHELIQPAVAGPDPFAGQRYWDQASVIIRINSNNTVSIGYPDPLNNYAFTAVPSSDWRYTMFNSAVSTNQNIQDNREGTTIRLATLDLSTVEASDSGFGNGVKYKSSNFNGIVYVYDASEASNARRGIRLKNGSSIPLNPSSGTSGLTVASNNPVYIQGDFNTGTGVTVPTNDPANLNSDGTYINQSNPPSPTVPGYNRAPCSIIADAVNLLSNSWSDANSGTVPPASPTTFNTAVIAGIVPTASVGGDGSYSGGAENFPRFLEDWTNKTLSYYGSMVELYASRQSIGEWGRPNVYVPPTREWFFDTKFTINPPPGSLMVYRFTKGRWYAP